MSFDIQALRQRAEAAKAEAQVALASKYVKGTLRLIAESTDVLANDVLGLCEEVERLQAERRASAEAVTNGVAALGDEIERLRNLVALLESADAINEGMEEGDAFHCRVIDPELHET